MAIVESNVSAVLLNWNGANDTISCLESLQALNCQARVIVCDNYSSDSSFAQIEKWIENNYVKKDFLILDREQSEQIQQISEEIKIVLIQTGGNLGFAGGNNVGVRFALKDSACRAIWLLNNDTVVQADALTEALSVLNSDPKIGICGSTLVYYDQPEIVQAWGGASFAPVLGISKHLGAHTSLAQRPTSAFVESKLSYVIGAAMLVKREYIEQIGLMAEDYFLYYEEIDWSTRGRAHFRFAYAPNSIVFHKEGASIGTNAAGGSPLSVYYLFRNRIKFTWRFYPHFLPAVFLSALKDAFKFLLKGRLPQFKAALCGLLQLSR